jgi:hypothetical protein
MNKKFEKCPICKEKFALSRRETDQDCLNCGLFMDLDQNGIPSGIINFQDTKFYFEEFLRFLELKSFI